jgi:prepilin-type N-terminal cleavage/methylation domain-containing protein
MKNLVRQKGFTLPEVMMAIVISMIVFSAMGVLLSRCFSLWVDAQAHWKLAQHARFARTRLLFGGFGAGSGILSSTNIAVSPSSSWNLITYDPVTSAGEFRIYGWAGTTPQNIWLLSDSYEWGWAQAMGVRYGAASPAVLVDDFSASLSNQTLTLNYTLNFSAMGKVFEHPQTVSAYLIND